MDAGKVVDPGQKALGGSVQIGKKKGDKLH